MAKSEMLSINSAVIWSVIGVTLFQDNVAFTIHLTLLEKLPPSNWNYFLIFDLLAKI